MPYTGDGFLLTDFPAAAIDKAVEAFVGSPLLHFEVRHLGGAAEVDTPITVCWMRSISPS